MAYGDYGSAPANSTANRDGTVALVCGIVGLFIFGIVLGIVAIYFGQRSRRAGVGRGTAGFVLGIIDVVLWVIVVTSTRRVYY